MENEVAEQEEPRPGLGSGAESQLEQTLLLGAQVGLQLPQSADASLEMLEAALGLNAIRAAAPSWDDLISEESIAPVAAARKETAPATKSRSSSAQTILQTSFESLRITTDSEPQEKASDMERPSGGEVEAQLMRRQESQEASSAIESMGVSGRSIDQNSQRVDDIAATESTMEVEDDDLLVEETETSCRLTTEGAGIQESSEGMVPHDVGRESTSRHVGPSRGSAVVEMQDSNIKGVEEDEEEDDDELLLRLELEDANDDSKVRDDDGDDDDDFLAG